MIRRRNSLDLSEYNLVFVDTFEQPDGSQPDPKKWVRSIRNSSCWARWISDHPDTAFIRNNKLVCRAVPNDGLDPNDDVPMLTGSVETRDRFSFTYGAIEVRMKTTRKIGNFPAVWMSADPHNEDKKYVEIDIVEMFGNIDTVASNCHTHRTVTLGLPAHAQTEFKKVCDFTQWHNYQCVWEPNFIAFYVDGTKIGQYDRPTDIKLLEEGAWTFDKNLVLRLNQSCGDGRNQYLAYPDVTDIYETEFDWIKVYRKPNYLVKKKKYTIK